MLRKTNKYFLVFLIMILFMGTGNSYCVWGAAGSPVNTVWTKDANPMQCNFETRNNAKNMVQNIAVLPPAASIREASLDPVSGNAGSNTSLDDAGTVTGIDMAAPEKIPVTITVAADQSKVYGTKDPAGFAYVCDVPGATFTGALSRTAGEDVGSYAINQGTLTGTDSYEITGFVGANFTILPKEIAVTAKPGQGKVFGTADPVLTYTSSEAVSLTGALGRAAGEDVGTYAINIGTLSAGGNYTINFTGADFTIYSIAVTTTPTASSVTTDSAVLGGEVTSGGDAVTERGIYLSSTNNMPSSADTKIVAAEGGVGKYSVTASGLIHNQHYYYRAYATTGTYTSLGSSQPFATLANTTTMDAQDITYKSAKLLGSYEIGGGAKIGEIGFYYSSKQPTNALNLSYMGTWTSATANANSFEANPTNLASNTTYYFTAYSSNYAGGRTYGNVLQFTTGPDPAVTFSPNGSTTAAKSHSTVVTINSGVKPHYLWTDGELPADASWYPFESGAAISQAGYDGTWYLWVRTGNVYYMGPHLCGGTYYRSKAFVFDNRAPVIKITGDNTVETPLGLKYEDAGATATDLHDGDLTANIVIDNPVDTSVAGTYTVTYSVSDSSGNTAQATRTVSVVERGSTIDPVTVCFDQTAGRQADIQVSVELNGNTLDAIRNGAADLTLDTDYSISGNLVTIKKEYLAGQAAGTTELTFDFSTGTDPVLSIAITAFENFNMSGNLQALKGPSDSVVDSEGNVYVCDSYNSRIVKFNASGAYQASYGSQGSSNEQLNKPIGLAIDQDGNIYVADTGNNRIVRFRDIDGSGKLEAGETQVWGGSAAGTGALQFSRPAGVYVQGETVMVADTGNYRIAQFAAGSPDTTWRVFGAQGSGQGQLRSPYDLTVDSMRNIWVSDSLNKRVIEFTASGGFVAQYACNLPYGISINSDNEVFTAERQTALIKGVNNAAVYGGKGDTPGLFRSPIGVNIDASGRLWIVDVTSGKIQSAVLP